jgi:hypothetical protein
MYYLAWRDLARNNPGLFIADVSRRGWEHITRRSRALRTKQQSLQLLPAAVRMLLRSQKLERHRLTPVREVKLPSGQTRRRWYEGVTARVTFYERHEAIVRVVVERTQLIASPASAPAKDIIQFYSVYEVARRRRGL